MNDPHYVEMQFNRINDTLMRFSAQLGGFAMALERQAEDRKEIGRALGAFRDDIQEIAQLGPMLKDALGRIDGNSRRIDAVAGDLADVEAWRQRQLGKAAARHGVIAFFGGGVALAGDFLVRWFQGRPHP